MDKDQFRTLIREAFAARKNAYTPYSRFGVGAALLTKSGHIYRGCNIENASYSVANCAERTAFFTAVAAGEREFAAIAIVGAPEHTPDGEGEICPPCGVCRQVMAEFCDGEDFLVILASSAEKYEVYTPGELLPLSFKLRSRQQKTS